ATGVTYWGIEAMRQGILTSDQDQTVTMSGIDVTASATILKKLKKVTKDSIWILNVVSENEEGIAREIEVIMQVPTSISELAICAEGEVDDDITPYDENDVIDYDLIEEYQTLPDFDLAGLLDYTIATFNGEMSLSNGFDPSDPSVTNPTWADSVDADPFFYWKDGRKLPHVIHVTSDIKLFQNVNYYGIFVVDGNVRIQSGHTEIHGVILQLDPTDTITEEDITLYGTTGERYKFDGGVYSYGSVNANGHPTVQHNPVYTETFAQYANEDLKYAVMSWKYK
ncbi:hypothetical protein ACFL4L_05220, partial [bacterium]